MRYEVNDINLCYQKDRDCGSLKINTLYGVKNKISSNHFQSSSFKEWVSLVNNKFCYTSYPASLNQNKDYSIKESLDSTEEQSSLTQYFILLIKETNSAIKNALAFVQYLSCISIKCDNTFQYIIIHQWHNEYPDWFTKQR